MKYVMIFHANLNYAYLSERRYEFVIRNSYELIFDTMRERFPEDKYTFEASGYTIEQMALKTPSVLKKLKAVIESGQCEFMGSPYAHPMLPNFPEEDGRWSIFFSNEIYKKYLGIQPDSFWNPECGWSSYVPKQIMDNGYKNLLGEFEAYSRSLDKDGIPLRPEIYELEKIEDSKFYKFDFQYDLPGDESAIHLPFKNLEGYEDSDLRIFMRTDRIAMFGVMYMMGAEGNTLENYIKLLKKYSVQKPGEPEGAVLLYADDAEYVGTNAWYNLKYCNDPDAIFEKMPDAQEKLTSLLKEVKKLGQLASFGQVCRDIPAVEDKIAFDDNAAWHGGKASNWADTPMAKLIRPWQDIVREKFYEKKKTLSDDIIKKFWFHLTNSYNSDGQWPPTTKKSPHIIFPFNYKYCFENLLTADTLLGGVDKSSLQTNPIQTMKDIFTMQQDLVLEKAQRLIEAGGEQKQNAELAIALIEKARNFDTLESDLHILYPSDYETRANLLMEARQLVGGVVVASDKD